MRLTTLVSQSLAVSVGEKIFYLERLDVTPFYTNYTLNYLSLQKNSDKNDCPPKLSIPKYLLLHSRYENGKPSGKTIPGESWIANPSTSPIPSKLSRLSNYLWCFSRSIAGPAVGQADVCRCSEFPWYSLTSSSLSSLCSLLSKSYLYLARPVPWETSDSRIRAVGCYADA